MGRTTEEGTGEGRLRRRYAAGAEEGRKDWPTD